MSDKKKNLLNGIFLLTVFVLTIYSVFSGEDLSDIWDTISEASPVYLLMGVGCVIFFIWAESAILHYLLGTLGIKTKRRTCFLYSSVGFFFSCITPSAGGGQPAQVYYMRKNMIPVPVATVVLMVVTIQIRAGGDWLSSGCIRPGLFKPLPVRGHACLLSGAGAECGILRRHAGSGFPHISCQGHGNAASGTSGAFSFSQEKNLQDRAPAPYHGAL